MKRILVIGAKGTVGSVISKGVTELNQFEVSTVDLPEFDMSNLEQVNSVVSGMNIVVYAADAKRGSENENWRSSHLYPENTLYEMNLLTAIVKHQVPRLIFCSSVHADNFLDYEEEKLLAVPGSHSPKSVYGAHKIFFEELVRFHSQQYGFEAVGIRLGGVTPDNSVRTHGKEPRVWLSHNDLMSLIQKICPAETVPDNFQLLYAVSNNAGRLHDVSNPFGWTPQDDSSIHLQK